MAEIGDILDERYRLLKVIGTGKWGCVFLAESLKLGTRWAIKEIDTTKDPHVNLLAEPKILKQLSHPHIPRIIDIIVQGGKHYIVEDFFDGVNLKELIPDRDKCSEMNVIQWAKQLCDILDYLHKLKPNPIIYRDMKPGNIIIDKENKARLIDFGIAREYNGNRQSDTTLIGTMGYAAPEQFRTGSLSDEKTDIYGLGMTLYHILTGQHPGSGIYPVRKIRPDVSAGIEKIILKCIHPNPEHRYLNARQLLNDLTDLENKSSFDKLTTVKKVIKMFGPGKVNHNEYTAKRNGRSGNPVIIAVAGAGRRVGCTHTSIVLANFLARLKYKIALVEMNYFGAFESLSPEHELPENGFTKKGVDYFPQNLNTHDQLGSIIRKEYNYVVLDMGNCIGVESDRQSENHQMLMYRELQRANLQLLVAGSAVWQLPEILPYLSNDELGDLKLVFTTPDPALINELKGQLKKDIYMTAYNPNPFNVSREQDNFCMSLLKGILIS